jgi:phospholipase C
MADDVPSSLSRRVVVKVGLAATAQALLVGCDKAPDRSVSAVITSPDAAAADLGAGPAPSPDPDVGPGALDAGRVEVLDAGPADDADTSTADAWPNLSDAERLAAIDTVVVLCMENRSFDHYLGARSLIEGRPVDGLTPAMKNPSRDGQDVFVNLLERYATVDPAHDWDPVHRQWNGGAMDGFAREFAGLPAADVMGYYGRDGVPVLWGMADHFVTCDRWFSSVLGPTWPNRMYLHGGTSLGVRDNVPIPFGFTSVFALMTEAGHSHANYFVDIPWATGGYLKTSGNLPIERFFSDAAAGTLPNFALVDPGFFGPAANDDHPAHDVRLGQAYIASIYRALAASPQWNRCLFVITYDEHGGFFDHVAPPPVTDQRADFRQLGVRVPAVVAGGPVLRGRTVSTVFDHVSVLATLTKRFGLRTVNNRITATNDLAGCIDPALVGRPQPAPELPPAPPVTMNRIIEIDRATRGVRPRAHAELWDLAQAGRIPRALDRRAQALEITRHWLGQGQRLGAFELR